MADTGGPARVAPEVQPDEDKQEEFVEGLYLGDAIRLFLAVGKAFSQQSPKLRKTQDSLTGPETTLCSHVLPRIPS